MIWNDRSAFERNPTPEPKSNNLRADSGLGVTNVMLSRNVDTDSPTQSDVQEFSLRSVCVKGQAVPCANSLATSQVLWRFIIAFC